MTQTIDNEGRAIFFPFPGQLQGIANSTGIQAIAATVDEHELLLFTKRLIDSSRKRRFDPRYCEVNRARIELARACIERALDEDLFAEWAASAADRSPQMRGTI